METSLIGPKSYLNHCGLILIDGPHYLILSVQDPQIYSQIDGQDLLSLSHFSYPTVLDYNSKTVPHFSPKPEREHNTERERKSSRDPV
jgi:hypothetical protein